MDLWDELCEVLRFHRPSDSCEETLNGIWRKNPFIKDQRRLPHLTHNNVRLLRETWSLDRFAELVDHRGLKTDLEPHALTGPIVVVRWAENDYLMDGRKRINHWIRDGGVEQKPVLIVVHQNDT